MHAWLLITILSLSFHFQVYAGDLPCEDEAKTIDIGPLSYSKNVMCGIQVSFNYPDGSTHDWYFDTSGKITVAAYNKSSIGWNYLTAQQVLKVPVKNSPRFLGQDDPLYPKNANPNELYVLMPNGKIASINKENGNWDFSRAFKAKVMPTTELANEIDKMKGKLDAIYPNITKALDAIPSDVKIKLNSKPPDTTGIPTNLVEKNKLLMKKYREQNIMENTTRIPDILVLEPSPDIINYGTRFGTPPTSPNWGNNPVSKQKVTPSKTAK